MILDTGQNIPERVETLKIQQRRMIEGKRPVQMFPVGTAELPLPVGMRRVANDRGVFHYNGEKISPDLILKLSAVGRENEFLELGPFSKPEIVERVLAGDVAVAIVEYTPDMIEVRSAGGTVKTAEVQRMFFEQTRDDGNLVIVGAPPQRRTA